MWSPSQISHLMLTRTHFQTERSYHGDKKATGLSSQDGCVPALPTLVYVSQGPISQAFPCPYYWYEITHTHTLCNIRESHFQERIHTETPVRLSFQCCPCYGKALGETLCSGSESSPQHDAPRSAVGLLCRAPRDEEPLPASWQELPGSWSLY